MDVDCSLVEAEVLVQLGCLEGKGRRNDAGCAQMSVWAWSDSNVNVVASAEGAEM